MQNTRANGSFSFQKETVQSIEVLQNEERSCSMCNLDNLLRLSVLTPPPPLLTHTTTHEVNTLCLRIGYSGSKEVKHTCTFMVTGEIEGHLSIRHMFHNLVI